MPDQVLKSDKKLEAALTQATTYDELQSILHNSLERSGIAERDPITGQFVRREQTAAKTPAAAADTEQQITKTETIGGTEFTFTGTTLEVERQIGDTYKIAEALQQNDAPPPPVVTPRSVRKTQADRDREVYDRTQLDLAFRRGDLTTEEYLTRTNAIGEYLESKGFDVDTAAMAQGAQSWAQAVETFLRETPEGKICNGGEKNLALATDMIIARGWDTATDKVAALRNVAAEMRAKGLEFDGDVSVEQANELANTMTPQEILESWKQTQADPEAANQEFIRLHSSGSGIFNR